MSRTRPNIVLAHWDGLDLFGDAEIEQLNQIGVVLNTTPLSRWAGQTAADLLAEADVLLGHWGCPRITTDMLDLAPNLGLFAYAAGTVKNVVIDELWERDIRVTTGANANAVPVAEFTMATILYANKGVLWRRGAVDPRGMSASLNRGGSDAYGNYDKTVGIVGASLIGRLVLERLQNYPDLRVALYDPFVTSAEAAALGATKRDLDDLCAESDVVSLHAPMLATTHHMIGAAQLALLRNGATVINTGRGPLIDHTALIAELEAGRLYAILDVTDPEPLPEHSPLHRLENAFLTPHLAGSQGTELNRILAFVIDEISRWSAGEPALNEITKEQLDRLA